MAKQLFKEADIDFDALDAKLAKLDPPKLTLGGVLERVRNRLVVQREKGVTTAQMCAVLKAEGVSMSERSLRMFLNRGELPQSKARGSVGAREPASGDTVAATDETTGKSDPF